jgi:quercetin dioxygenase-like cupin family protein
MKRLILLSIATMLSAANAQAGEQSKAPPPVSISEILSTDVNSAGQKIVFPKKNGHVTVSVFTIQPGASLPVHEHPYPRMAYVLDGILRVTNMVTNRATKYSKGDFVLEAVKEWHQGDNPGSQVLTLLVIDLVPKGAENTILR